MSNSTNATSVASSSLSTTRTATTQNHAPQSFSRFHAIVSAKPVIGAPPPMLHPGPLPDPRHATSRPVAVDPVYTPSPLYSWSSPYSVNLNINVGNEVVLDDRRGSASGSGMGLGQPSGSGPVASSSKKRSNEHQFGDDVGMTPLDGQGVRVHKVLKLTAADDDDPNAKGAVREPAMAYRDREELMAALVARFKATEQVDFNGTYRISDSTTGMTHKQRIQTVTHEIWKATGYRFTVKDHPQLINGHKTRFWCSQDDAHRSKSTKAAQRAQGAAYKPRVTSAGDVVAKNRYPCKSRLLISSRDADEHGMRIITIRLHHEVAHEPYVDVNLPPEVAQNMWESFGWVAPNTGHGLPSTAQVPQPQATQGSSSTHTLSTHPQPPQLPPSFPSSFSSAMEEDHSSTATHSRSASSSHLSLPDLEMAANSPVSSSIPSASHPSAPPRLDNPAMLNESIFQSRMRAHIKNLREFCNGLEYQLQFNDPRLLETIEHVGGPFFSYVEDCLRQEGCATTPPSLPVAKGLGPGDVQSSSNPGINPSLLKR